MLPILLSWVLLTCLGYHVEASFNIYDAYTPDELQQAQGISSGCSDALNMTIDCDENNLSRAAEGIDLDYWFMENITSICTTECSNSLRNWLSAVEQHCATDTLEFIGSRMQAKTVPVVFKSAHDVACLQDSESNWCFFESQHWQGSDFLTYDGTACWQEDTSLRPPECDEFGRLTGLGPGMTDVTNMYDRELLCNECFVKMWRQRLLSPFIQDSDATTYLVEQYQAIQQNCSIDLPLTTSSFTLFVSSTVPTATATPTTTGSVPAMTTCLGQLIDPPGSDEFPDCQDMAERYKVPTGDIISATGDSMCQFSTSICLPLPCEGEVIWDGQSCDELASQYSTESFKVTRQIFLSWNPNVVGSCTRLMPGQRVCSQPPGGQFAPTGVIYAPTAAGSYYSTDVPSAPTQSGTTDSCGHYYTVVRGDTCNSLSLRFGVNFTMLKNLNTFLNNDCTNLWLGYAACVAPVTPVELSTDGTCGLKANHATCEGTSFGPCCSTSGDCGSSPQHCGAGNCFSGACQGNSTGVTTDGTCGPATSCDNPSFGPCCSTSGYCGSTSAYCDPGNCYSGACNSNEGGPSVDGSCGPNFTGNKTCAGTQFGPCCSTSGYCGASEDYCARGNCYSGACE